MTLPRNTPVGAGAASGTTVYVVVFMPLYEPSIIKAVKSSNELAEAYIDEQPIGIQDELFIEARQVDDPLE